MSKRERIEDLGIISEKLFQACDLMKELDYLIKAVRPSANADDLALIYEKLEGARCYVQDAWYVARFGDDEDLIDDVCRKRPES